MSNSSDSITIVGRFLEDYNTRLGASFDILDIVQSHGLITHVQKKHPAMVGYMSNIADILQNPDYIGMNPTVPDSIELVKVYSDNILVAIKLDTSNDTSNDASNGYYYIASLYDITTAKLNKRISNGRLIKY